MSRRHKSPKHNGDKRTLAQRTPGHGRDSGTAGMASYQPRGAVAALAVFVASLSLAASYAPLHSLQGPAAPFAHGAARRAHSVEAGGSGSEKANIGMPRLTKPFL